MNAIEATDLDGKKETVLSLQGITKSYGLFKAVDNLSLNIRRGEVFSLLGPSGCGKSTTLRQIAGLDRPIAGVIKLNDKTLFSAEKNIFVPTQNRNMGMVFQSYAIWPHLSIYETVAYPLRLRKVPGSKIDAAVRSIIRQVGLEGMEDRPPATLSGGQQQRVALARALIYRPDVLLLDEPFSNLDVKLREQMRIELKLLQRQIGVTVILVTHDQSEALSLSDRIAVMNKGRAEQVSTPSDLYENPKTPFVRDFIGQTTKLKAEIITLKGGSEVDVSVGQEKVKMTSSSIYVERPECGQRVTACVRPEDILIASAAQKMSHNVSSAVVETILFLGDRKECLLRFGGQKILAYVPRSERLTEGETVPVSIGSGALGIWPFESGEF